MEPSMTISLRLSKITLLTWSFKEAVAASPLSQASVDSGDSLVLPPNSTEKANVLPEEAETGEHGSRERGCGKLWKTRGTCGRQATSSAGAGNVSPQNHWVWPCQGIGVSALNV